MNKKYIPFDYRRAEAIAKRTKKFYEGPVGKAQIHIKSCGDLGLPPIPPLNSWKFPEDMKKYLDLRAQCDYYYAQFHEQIEDDYIPSTSPWYGIAEHTAFLGGKVDFTESTTFQHEICENLEDFRNLKLDCDNPWIYLVAGGMKYMRETWGEYIPVRMRGADGPSDIANAIRGSALFYDIYDDPETLAELMSFCAKAANFTLDLQRAEATRIADGCINGFGLWMPGKCMGQLSEDFSTMISTEFYEEHFLPSLHECVKDCDGAMLHVHSLGHRMIPMFAGIEKIQLMEISSDPNSERAVDIIRKYHDDLKEKTIIVAPTYEELANMEDILASSKTVVWYHATDKEDAKRAMAIVEKYR